MFTTLARNCLLLTLNYCSMLLFFFFHPPLPSIPHVIRKKNFSDSFWFSKNIKGIQLIIMGYWWVRFSFHARRAINIMDSQLKIVFYADAKICAAPYVCNNVRVHNAMQFIQINTHFVQWCRDVCLCSAHGARELSKAYRNGPITMMQKSAHLLDCRRLFVFQPKYIITRCAHFAGFAAHSIAVAQSLLRSSSLWSIKKK